MQWQLIATLVAVACQTSHGKPHLRAFHNFANFWNEYANINRLANPWRCIHFPICAIFSTSSLPMQWTAIFLTENYNTLKTCGEMSQSMAKDGQELIIKYYLSFPKKLSLLFLPFPRTLCPAGSSGPQPY